MIKHKKYSRWCIVFTYLGILIFQSNAVAAFSCGFIDPYLSDDEITIDEMVEIISIIEDVDITVQGTNEILKTALSSNSTPLEDFKVEGGTVLDLLGNLASASKVHSKLLQNEYGYAVWEISKIFWEHKLEGISIYSNILSPVKSIAALAALPIKIGIEKFMEQALEIAYNNQVKLYLHARKLPVTHPQIMTQNIPEKYIVQFTSDGWLYIVEDMRIPSYGPVIPNSSRDFVYNNAKMYFEQISNPSQFRKQACDAIHHVTKQIANLVSIENEISLIVFDFRRSADPIYASNKNKNDNFDAQFKIRNNDLSPIIIDDMAIAILENGVRLFDCWKKGQSTNISINGFYETGIQRCEIYDPGDYTVEVRLRINGNWQPPYDLSPFTVLHGNSLYDNELAIVLDKSGSMSEVSKENGKIKIEKAKEAIASVVPVDASQLGVSLSVFSDSAEIIKEMTSVESFQASMQQTLDLIQPDGGTNIGSGLSLAYQELDKTSSTGGGSKVAELLSDGQNNRGEWKSIVQQFIDKGWPIYTIPFGLDADHKTLREIARQTGAIFDDANTNNLTSVFQRHINHSQKRSDLVIVSDNLPPDGQATYPFSIGSDSQNLKVQTSWLGSQLRSQLIAPGGKQFADADTEQLGGRYFEGDTFQSMTIPNPTPGEWSLQVDWSEPPEIAEQININITNKTDLAVSIFGLKPSYQINETVNILIDIDDVSSGRRAPVNNTSVMVEVQKPEEEIIQLLHAKTSRWEVYKEVERDITRTVEMFDDGRHGDFDANDGVYGGYYQETDLNGPYTVSLEVSGVMENDSGFFRQIHASFQVGDITNNLISNSHWLQAKHYPKNEIDDLLNDATFIEPLDTLNDLMKGQSDSLDSLLD